MKAKNINIVKGESVQHVCTGTTAGDFAKDDLALNIMYSIHAGDFPRHGHEYDELNIVTRGRAVHVTDFETYTIEKGDVFVINGEHQHEFQDCEDLGIAVIQFAPDEIQRNLEDLNLLMGYHGLFDIETRPPSGRAHRQRFKLQTEDLAVCQSLFKAMKNEFEEEKTGYRVMVRSQFAQLVLLLCRYYEVSKQNEDQFAVSMANVASYICQNFKKQIRQEDLAEISGLSVSQMQRRFRSVYGESPVKMINQIRVEEAKKLLKNDVYDLNWIAVQTGYSAASFFSTQFKQFTGMTPREYRKQWQQANDTNGKVTSNFSTFKALLLFFTVFSFMSPSLQAEDKANEIDLLFLRKIKPMLAEKCFGCHGENKEKIKADYIMLDRESLIKGGDSGHAAIIPGDAAKSPIMELIKRVDEDDAMPPKESEKLTAAQIGWMEDWINAGANWPDDSLLENDENFVKVEVSGALSKDWAERRYNKEDIWAFQPVRKVTPPKSNQAHPLDKFIAAKLKDNGLKMAKAADKAKIARRAYLNLTGINPSFDQIQAFVNDSSKNALDKLIDKLLASKHYGEQAARNWFDVVRYADTGGYANDWERPHVWRYRDYVIRSFNDDKPYNQFVIEQIAGDELTGNEPDHIIATGFLRTGPWEHTTMSVSEVTRQLFLDDVTESVGKTFLAQPVGCAKCHDHKFDPIPTRDYYRMQAVFSTAHFADTKVPFQHYENLGDKERNLALSQERIKLIDKSLEMADEESRISTGPITSKQKKYFNLEKKRYIPGTFSIKNGPELPKTRILTGGALESPAEEVTPGVLSAVHASNDRVSPTSYNTIPETNDGRRLAFAKWVANEKNTLTARVIVNRIWQQHFNKGIVATPNSFGKMGAKPTHPELLDYLATWFVDNGWSIKKLHKFIMTTNAFQMASVHNKLEVLAEKDPDNKLLAYFPPRRLQAEMIYDTLLNMTNELNPEMGGPGVFPEINWEVALQNRLIMGTLAPAWQPSVKRSERHRRQIYAFVRRSVSDPFLEVFNKPGSELSCAKRDETTVTPQSFSLFNSEFSHNRSIALANKIYTQTKNVDEQVSELFKEFYGRMPSSDETKIAKAHIAKMTEFHKKNKVEKVPLKKVFNATFMAERTGKPAKWTQQLNNLTNYERDLMPWEVNAEVRGLYELCLIMANSNEFLYVY